VSQKHRIHHAVPQENGRVRVPCITTGARRRSHKRVAVSTLKSEVTCPRCIALTKEQPQ
jgi:hypothetical protein